LFSRQARLIRPALLEVLDSKFVKSAAPLARTSRNNKTPGDMLASLMPHRNGAIRRLSAGGAPYDQRHIDGIMLPEFIGGTQVQFV
jgi:hypothetical protein